VASRREEQTEVTLQRKRVPSCSSFGVGEKTEWVTIARREALIKESARWNSYSKGKKKEGAQTRRRSKNLGGGVFLKVQHASSGGEAEGRGRGWKMLDLVRSTVKIDKNPQGNIGNGFKRKGKNQNAIAAFIWKVSGKVRNLRDKEEMGDRRRKGVMKDQTKGEITMKGPEVGRL